MKRHSLFRVACAVFLLHASGANAATENTLDLHAYQGKVVYVDFWASWCGPCRESFPWLRQVDARYQDKGLVVVGVNLDHDRQLADDFLKFYRPGFLIVFDEAARLADEFHVKGMPASFLIDRNGKVRYQHIGFRMTQHREYEHDVEALLAEP